MDYMREFWFYMAILALLMGSVVGVLSIEELYGQRHSAYEATTTVQLVRYALLGSLVASAWAVCFRKQVERLRASIFSIMVLIGMQAAMLWADRVLKSR
jgi:hypothetical protein